MKIKSLVWVKKSVEYALVKEDYYLKVIYTVYMVRYEGLREGCPISKKKFDFDIPETIKEYHTLE